MKDPRALERVAGRFGLSPTSDRLLEALTHPSFANEVNAAHNQRLEFLGDALLGLLTAELLFERFPSADEGELTRTRAQIVSAPALAEFGRKERIPEALRLGKGQRASLLDSENVVADAVEALLAATYLDHGLEAARVACQTIVEFGLAQAPRRAALDPKSELQARVQALGYRPPVYEEVLREGPAHDMTFEFLVRVGDEERGRGRGRSKRSAEQEAARDALLALDQVGPAGLETGAREAGAREAS
ncbi:MAG TPA: ribonuclease III, partial [Polyangiaceae bacterium]|nr:ribonuclease III [Polyangiaceae bacterium]